MPGTDRPSSHDGNERITPRSSRSQEPSALANDLTLSNTVTADPFLHRQLSHYRLEEQLGVGGMGVLYRATDLNLRRSVAIKLTAQSRRGGAMANTDPFCLEHRPSPRRDTGAAVG